MEKNAKMYLVEMVAFLPSTGTVTYLQNILQKLKTYETVFIHVAINTIYHYEHFYRLKTTHMFLVYLENFKNNIQTTGKIREHKTVFTLLITII